MHSGEPIPSALVHARPITICKRCAVPDEEGPALVGFGGGGGSVRRRSSLVLKAWFYIDPPGAGA